MLVWTWSLYMYRHGVMVFSFPLLICWNILSNPAFLMWNKCVHFSENVAFIQIVWHRRKQRSALFVHYVSKSLYRNESAHVYGFVGTTSASEFMQRYWNIRDFALKTCFCTRICLTCVVRDCSLIILISTVL